MILAHIIVRDKEQAMEIASCLTRKKLILNAGISVKEVFELNKRTKKLERKEQTLIIGKTKALLFAEINNALKTKYKETMPWLYAIPIVYMDEEQTIFLRANTAKI
ncbi:hypothetical protein [Maribacter sp. 2210JD10-5]|uniref:hypothetical protein n=1 Tax=Maribacter sp. 2210JD10-5 TaxID=3386272 RepID=UPI0039BCF336